MAYTVWNHLRQVFNIITNLISFSSNVRCSKTDNYSQVIHFRVLRVFYVFKDGYADNGNDNGNETFHVRSYYTVASCSHHSMLGKYPGWFVTTHHYIAPLLFPYCTARQCSPLGRKFMECYIIKPAQSLLMIRLVIGQR